MHRVAILALNDVSPGDLAIPWEVFSRAPDRDGSPAYVVRVCAEAPEICAGAFRLRAPWTLAEAALADTVIVPGRSEAKAPIAETVLETIRAAHGRGARVASICSGAFVLAAAGLLDGRRATTHWLAAPALAAAYPSVRVDADVLFVDEGSVLTSAGASAGLDLCLHMIRRDHGQAVAAEAARLAVAPLDRAGGQAQFIRREPPASSASLAALLEWMATHLDERLTLEDLARWAAASPRTLSRRFRAQTGLSPLQWLLIARVRRAQELLETTSLPIEAVALRAGFESAGALRERFRRVFGVSPLAYRGTFNPASDKLSR
ncbi:MAG TPA: helix-turn-helix domain-containing protein [Caulobacteraceae bacterium]|jgi:transcriptional regulator GlxA family with amidase domain|nr:helix-turn-helix domain-containing protein [Caulobacteraceae bacterium]